MYCFYSLPAETGSDVTTPDVVPIALQPERAMALSNSNAEIFFMIASKVMPRVQFTIMNS